MKTYGKLIIAFVAGILIAAASFAALGQRYELRNGWGARMYRLDHWTGKTWIGFDNGWRQLPEPFTATWDPFKDGGAIPDAGKSASK